MSRELRINLGHLTDGQTEVYYGGWARRDGPDLILITGLGHPFGFIYYPGFYIAELAEGPPTVPEGDPPNEGVTDYGHAGPVY